LRSNSYIKTVTFFKKKILIESVSERVISNTTTAYIGVTARVQCFILLSAFNAIEDAVFNDEINTATYIPRLVQDN